MIVFAGVAVASILISVSLILKPGPQDTYPNTIQLIIIILVSVAFGIPTFIAFLLLPCGLVCFSANVIQYGMDQLHAAPTNDSMLYIHWYVWTSYAGLMPMKLVFNINWHVLPAFSACLISLPLVLLGLILCIQ